MRLAAWLLGLSLCACSRPPPAKPVTRIAAASDLAPVLEALKGPFEQQTGQHLELIFGSSGQLSRQLTEGAPFDLFASANEAFLDEPIRSGACDPATRARYAEGRLVIVSPREPLTKLEDLKEPRFARIALANPEHAPYGKAAKEALIAAGLWGALEKRIVYAENIQQTLQFARSGNVEAALVARSLAKDGLPVDPSLHAPLKQGLVVCTHGRNPDAALAFAKLLLGEKGQQALVEGGFALPGAP